MQVLKRFDSNDSGMSTCVTTATYRGDKTADGSDSGLLARLISSMRSGVSALFGGSSKEPLDPRRARLGDEVAVSLDGKAGFVVATPEAACRSNGRIAEVQQPIELRSPPLLRLAIGIVADSRGSTAARTWRGLLAAQRALAEARVASTEWGVVLWDDRPTLELRMRVGWNALVARASAMNQTMHLLAPIRPFLRTRRVPKISSWASLVPMVVRRCPSLCM